MNPPFQVPDEQFHFYRAYQISESTLISTKNGYETGDYLPSSLPRTAFNFMNGISSNLEGRIGFTAWTDAFKISLDPENPAAFAGTLNFEVERAKR